MPRSVFAGAKHPPYYAHLQTFARLREPTSADLPALLDLGRAAGAEGFDWERASGISILRFRRHLMGYGVHQLLMACGFQMTGLGYERHLAADRT